MIQTFHDFQLEFMTHILHIQYMLVDTVIDESLDIARSDVLIGHDGGVEGPCLLEFDVRPHCLIAARRGSMVYGDSIRSVSLKICNSFHELSEN